jgi:transcriptional regulator with GAF, ATPase, and Fis domain
MRVPWNDPTESVRDAVQSVELVAVVRGEAARLSLAAQGTYSVGRGEGVSLRLDDGSVSRVHAEFLVEGSRIQLRDLGSSNGTRVNGVALEARRNVDVSSNAVIEFGSVCSVLRGGPTKVGSPTGTSMDELLSTLDLVARSQLSVLLLGESGVGKEVLAARIHKNSPRCAKPFVKVNCAALVDSLLEAELFGFERGAFTGAVAAKTGLLESAHEGTFFLDEVGEMPLTTQAKLLRVLETREVQRVGSLRPRTIDVRFVAATNRDLRASASEGRFRQDLFFRLEGFTARIPPLRERREEILPLAKMFIDEACEQSGRPRVRLDSSAQARLLAHSWPGNVRELRNVCSRSVVLCAGDVISSHHMLVEDGRIAGAPDPTEPQPLASHRSERERILQALTEAGGNQKRAALALNISVRTLQNRLDSLGLPRPRKS